MDYFHVVLGFILICFLGTGHCEVKKEEKNGLKERTLKMFYHAYDSYMKYAYPADELMPLSCKGRYRGSEPDRGDIDETLGNFSLTLIDTLDTLAVLGNVTEFDKAVRLVISEVKFDTDVVVSVFETNIRVLGGLLGGHVAATVLQKENKGMKWYKGELLDMAVDIADRLLVAFNTTTGIPYPRINLLHGIHHPMSRIVNEKDTCTACGGTMIMEFAALSRLTGDPIYEKKARKAMESIWHYRSRSSDLVGTVIDVHNGDWIRRDSGIGAGIDSYYEYCLKAYILLGDTSYLEKFNKHYAAINKYIRQGVMMLDVLMHQPDRPIRSFVDSLQAFWPGLQVLMGDLKPAIETHEMLYEVAKRHKFIPEAFTTNFDLYWSQHPLRPEFAESTYFLYEATKDPYYLEVGKHIIETLEEHAKVQCGFAAIKDLRTFTHEDKMDSFVLAETFKYLYLLFSEDSDRILNIHNFVFTTEAHLLPLSLGNVKFDKHEQYGIKNKTKIPKPSPKRADSPSTCPNDAKDRFSMREFARIVRKGYKKPVPATPMCTTSSETKHQDIEFNYDPSREPKLRAEHFQVGNTEHMQLLKDMGISVLQTNDGKVQLVHQAGTAATADDASDGIKFMQDMIHISKTRGGDQAAAAKPRVVQLMSPPFNGDVFYGAGAAQFGLDISSHSGVTAEVVDAVPYNACNEIENKDQFEDRIVIAERGGCMFIDKVRRAQGHGAKGVIVIDNNENTSVDQPMFAMSGDSHSEDVKIPSVFLFRKDGDKLRQYAKDSIDQNNIRLQVRLAGNPKNVKAESNLKAGKSGSAEHSNETGEESNDKPNDTSTSESTVSYDGPNTNGDVTAAESQDDNEAKGEHVLDKMESSMEKIPKVVSIDGQRIATKVETHIGRNEEGNMVTYETTFTTYESDHDPAANTQVRVSTRIIPFKQNALEIDKNRLDEINNSDVMEKDPDSDKKNGNVQIDVKGEKEETKNAGKEYAGDETEVEEQRQLNRFEEERQNSHDNKEKISENSSSKGSKTLEKGDTGLKEKDTKGGSLGETISTREETVEKIGQRKHDVSDKISGAKKEGRLGGSRKEKSGETMRKEPEQPVICNGAGCFSTIEELEMFNEMALKVRSNLRDLEQAESAIEGHGSRSIDAKKLSEDNDKNNEDIISSKSKPTLR